MPFVPVPVRALLPVVMAFAAVGCRSGKTNPMDIQVSLVGPEAQKSRVHVDLIGVTKEEIPRLGDVPMSKYVVSRSEVVPADRTKSFDLGPGATTQTLSHTDPIWKTWSQIPILNLYVFSDYPRLPEDRTNDPRKLLVTLDGGRWDRSVERIEIRIEPTGVTVVPQPNPEK